jgi:hypothetical protein
MPIYWRSNIIPVILAFSTFRLSIGVPPFGRSSFPVAPAFLSFWLFYDCSSHKNLRKEKKEKHKAISRALPVIVNVIAN